MVADTGFSSRDKNAVDKRTPSNESEDSVAWNERRIIACRAEKIERRKHLFELGGPRPKVNAK